MADKKKRVSDSLGTVEIPADALYQAQTQRALDNFDFSDLRLPAAHATEIGINCRICPRSQCDQRAQQGVTLIAPVDANRRGATRYET